MSSRSWLLVVAAVLGCGPAAPVPEADPPPAATARPVGGTRLVLPEDRATEPVELGVTSPVSPGDTATATVKAPAGSRCTIRVTYRSGPSEAKGLEPLTVDESGLASWSWMVGINTTPGEWPVEVECVAPVGSHARGRGLLTVQESGPATPIDSVEAGR